MNLPLATWLSIPLAVCAWAYLEGCRRRNLITRLGRLLHIACLLTMIAWYHARHHVRAAWYFACWAWLYFGGTLRRAARAAADPPELAAAIQAHPAGRSVRSVKPLDGPFTAWEAEHQAWRHPAGQDA